jgi:hypothetical protein
MTGPAPRPSLVKRVEALTAERDGLVVERDRYREALLLVENMHEARDKVFRAVAMHALGRPDALGYLRSYNIESSLDADVAAFLARVALGDDETR